MKIINGMEFINDERAIGKWDFFDRIKSLDEFDAKRSTNPNSEYDFKMVYFLPNGQGYWIFEGWTKGLLVVCYGGDEPFLEYKYEIKEVESKKFMFVNNDEEQYINVLVKASSTKFSIEDIKRKENIDLPFVNDERIIGKWKTIDYVENIDEFKGKKKSDQTLWLESAEFYPDGSVYRKYYDTEWRDKWTKGALLDQKKSVVSHYSFKIIDGVEYMFLEWKMGNYVYGGMPATYYVFEREGTK